MSVADAAAPPAVGFRAVLQRSEASGAACWVDVPFDLKATFGKGNLVPVVALWDGRVTYRGSLAKMGGPCAMLLCRKDVLAALGKAAGDEVDVHVTLDTSPRPVEVPEALQAALDARPDVAAWERLSPSCRREYADWVGEAKRPATRDRRVVSALAGIVAGRRLR